MTPAVAGDRLHVGACSGTLFALDAASGDVAWRYDTSADGRPAGQFHGDFLIAGDLLVAGTDAPTVGHLYAFSRADGKTHWKLPFPKGVAVDLVAHGPAVLFASESGYVAAVEIATGEPRWQIRPFGDASPTARPLGLLLAGDRLVVAWRSGAVDAYHLADGRLLWRRDLGARLAAAPILVPDEPDPRGPGPDGGGAGTGEAATGDVVVGTFDGRLHRLRIADGEPVASLALGGALYGELVAAPGCLLALSARGGFAPGEGLRGPHALVCVEPSLSGVRWRHQQAGAWGTEHPLVHGATVVAGVEGRLLGLHLADGKLQWERPVEGLPRGLGTAASRLYVGTREGPFFAFRW